MLFRSSAAGAPSNNAGNTCSATSAAGAPSNNAGNTCSATSAAGAPSNNAGNTCSATSAAGAADIASRNVGVGDDLIYDSVPAALLSASSTASELVTPAVTASTPSVSAAVVSTTFASAPRSTARPPARIPRADAPIEAIREWIDPLGEHPEWEGRIKKMIEGLFWLGVRRVSQVHRLDRPGLIVRFGELGTILLSHLDDGPGIPVTPYVPKLQWIERKEFWDESGAEDLTQHLFEIKILLDRLLQRLFARGRAITALRVRMEKERKKIGKIERTIYLEMNLNFTFPQSDGKAILKMIAERLSRKLEEAARAEAYAASDDEEVRSDSGSRDRKSTRLNSSHSTLSRMPSSA